MNSRLCYVGNTPFDLQTPGSPDDYAMVAGEATANTIFCALSKMPGPMLTVIDVGANVGTVAVTLGALFPGRIKVYAVEPHPVLFEALQRNIDTYSCKDAVIPLCNAVGSDQKYISGKLASANTGESKTSAQASPGSIPCFTTSLDALVLRAPAGVDVLKVDVEGAEYDIFHAFTLWSRVGKYHIEYHDVEPWREEALRRYGLWDDELGPIPPLQKLIHGKLGLTYWTRHTRML